MSNRNSGDNPELQIEDYGSSDSEGGSGAAGGSGSQADKGGRYSGGTEGTSGSNEGEFFGEYRDTGTGVDLTEEMENTDVRSGLVKGGEPGSSGVAGPGQYGGDAGSLNKD